MASLAELTGLSPRPRAAVGVELDRTVRDGEAEGCADGALHELDLATVGADELGGDGEAEPGSAAARGRLEGLEQMLARPGREARAGVRHLDHRHRAFAAAGDADLVTRWIARRPRLQRLNGVTRQIEQHAEKL